MKEFLMHVFHAVAVSVLIAIAFLAGPNRAAADDGSFDPLLLRNIGDVSKEQALKYGLIYRLPLQDKVVHSPLIAHVEVVDKIPDCARLFRRYEFRVLNVAKQDPGVLGKSLAIGETFSVWNIGVSTDCGPRAMLTSGSFTFKKGDQAIVLLHDHAFDRKRFGDSKPFLMPLIEYFQVADGKIYDKNGYAVTSVATVEGQKTVHRGDRPEIGSAAFATTTPLGNISQRQNEQILQSSTPIDATKFLNELKDLQK